MRVKRDSVREAILTAAAARFSADGYLRATIGAIAKDAGTAASNVYVYFPCKLEIALAVFEPWLKKEVLALEKAARKAEGPEAKVRLVVDGIVRRIPLDHKGRTTTLMQALSSARPSDRYNPQLLHWTEGKISQMLHEACGLAADECDALARALMLIFDGVALRRNLSIATVGEELVDVVCALVLRSAPAGSKSMCPRSRVTDVPGPPVSEGHGGQV